jgi:hypothetical protein
MGKFRRAAYFTRNAELWHSLPPEAQRIYSEFEPIRESLSSGTTPRLREKRIALEALVSLCGNDNVLSASSIISKNSPHLRGSSLERTLHLHAIEARNDLRLKAIMTPAIHKLIDEGVSRIAKYVESRRPLKLDDYRAGFAVLRTAALFNPAAVRSIGKDLWGKFGSETKEYPLLAGFLPAMDAWGSDPGHTSESDLKYLDFCRKEQDNSAAGPYFANHVLAYYAPPRVGRRLTEMMPSDSRVEMTENADRFRESLINAATLKGEEGFANAGWIGATFLKVQMAILYLDGCWTKLSPSQARRLQGFILLARHETQCLDGQERRRLHASMSSIENTLIRNADYGLRRKIYRTRDRGNP